MFAPTGLFAMCFYCRDFSKMQCPKRTTHPKTKKHATSETSRNCVQILGAVNQIRTGDLFLTKEVLYQLSYNSI